ncbi:Fc receptor-like protein 5, partial [Nibea albiflora]
ANRPKAELSADDRYIPVGGSVTLTCSVKPSSPGWKYSYIRGEKPTSSNFTYSTGQFSVSLEGTYWCRGRRQRPDSYKEYTNFSDSIRIYKNADRPKAELSADDRDIPVGGSVTLTCSVKPSSPGWKYFWYRGEKTSEPLTTQDVLLSTGQFSVSQEGVYRCRGGRGEPVDYTEYSDSIRINKNVDNKAAVTLQPNWSEIFRGETITLRCEIKNGGDTEWEYEWKTSSSTKPSSPNEVSIRSASVSHSGVYSCKGRMKNDQSTDWSDPINLTVSDKPLPVLTVSPLWLNAGASVTLNCEVEHPSAGWRFYWYKTVPKLPGNDYSPELLPDSSKGTEQDSYIVHGQTGTAGYVCRAGRGDPVYYTQYSRPQFVWSGDSHSSASLTVSPDRVQHFTSDSVSLNCEGNSTEWRVKRFTGNSHLSHCSSWGTMTGSTCNMYGYRQPDGVFWYRNILLLSPDHPVTEGDPVSLSCKLRTGIFDSNVFFYRNDELIQNDARKELNISAVSKSDEGFYKCQHSGEESSQSWMSVKGEQSQSERTNQGSDTNQVVNQNEAEGGVYSTLLHANRPKAELSADDRYIPEGGSVTLTCSVKPSSPGWKYSYIRGEKPSSSNITISTGQFSVSLEGLWWCRGRRQKPDSYTESTEYSDSIRIYKNADRPKAELSADDRDIPVGGSVTLTCSVKPSSPGWKYFWYRGEKTSEPLTTQDVLLSTGQFSVSQEGVYMCRGGRGEPVDYTEYSDSISINKNVDNKAAVTLQPNWSEIFSGETITLRCEIKNGGDTEWEYEWKTSSSTKPSSPNEVSIRSASVSHSGVYSCKGRMKNDQSTDWSDPINLTVSDKPLPVLTVSPSWLNAGDSVTLNCEVEHPSAGWRFYWYKTVPKLPGNDYSPELLPDSSNGTDKDSYIVHGQTGTAGYVCRAGRGDPVYYTLHSRPQFVWSGDSHSSASLTVSPDRVQHFTSDSVSLNCEGNSTEWRVMRLYRNSYLSHCSSWGTMTGSTCNMDGSQQSDGVFWYRNILLLSPDHPVTEGDPVSLSCKLRTGIFDSNVFFYRNDELIQNDTRKELNISAVSKSDEGFYKCQHSGEESSQSWMSVKGKQHGPEESSVYSDVRTRTADDNLTYAQVNYPNKGKGKKPRGKPRPAETDETVYSDVKPGRSLV